MYEFICWTVPGSSNNKNMITLTSPKSAEMKKYAFPKLLGNIHVYNMNWVTRF